MFCEILTRQAEWIAQTFLYERDVFMQENDRIFWIQMMDKLNQNDEQEGSLENVLKDICLFFGFGAGFIYQTDHTGLFHLIENYVVYKQTALPQTMALDAPLGKHLMEELAGSKAVSFRDNFPKDDLAKVLSDVFAVRSLVLVPVVDGKTHNVIALVGISDRRGTDRLMDEGPSDDDMSFAYSALSTLGTYVKMRMYQARVESTHRALESVLDNMGVDVYVNDFETHEIMYLNRSMAAPYGGIEKMIGMPCWQALYADKTGECDYCPRPRLLDEKGEPTKIYGWDYKRPFDGSWFRVLSAAFPWVDGRMVQVVTSVDITENKQNEEIIRQMAEYDHLTGLPNRFRLTSVIDARIPELMRQGHKGYLLFFDLDGFKAVNDTLGHRAGDDLLVQIGEKLQSGPFTRGNCYRYGGDEFVILCEPEQPGDIRRLLEFLKGIFATPWKLDEAEVTCQASIGVSCFPTDDEKSSSLLRMADQAMYTAKNSGKGQVRFYDEGALGTEEAYYEKYAI